MSSAFRVQRSQTWTAMPSNIKGELRVPRSGQVDELSVPHSAEPELAGEVELPSSIKGELCVPRSGEVDSDLDMQTTKDWDMESDLDMDSDLDSDYQEFCSRRNAFLNRAVAGLHDSWSINVKKTAGTHALIALDVATCYRSWVMLRNM